MEHHMVDKFEFMIHLSVLVSVSECHQTKYSLFTTAWMNGDSVKFASRVEPIAYYTMNKHKKNPRTQHTHTHKSQYTTIDYSAQLSSAFVFHLFACCIL